MSLLNAEKQIKILMQELSMLKENVRVLSEDSTDNELF